MMMICVWAFYSNLHVLQLVHLVGPTFTGPVQDPLAVLSLENQLCMKNDQIRGT